MNPVTPFAFEIDSVVTLLEKRFGGRIENAELQLETVVPEHLVFLPVRIAIGISLQREGVVSTGGPVGEARLAHIYLGCERICPIVRLLRSRFLHGGRRKRLGSFLRSLLHIILSRSRNRSTRHHHDGCKSLLHNQYNILLIGNGKYHPAV